MEKPEFEDNDKLPKDHEFERRDSERQPQERLNLNENACHLRANGEFGDSSLSERASSAENKSDTLEKLFNETKSKIKDLANEIYESTKDKTLKDRLMSVVRGTQRLSPSFCEDFNANLDSVQDGFLKDFTNGYCKMTDALNLMNENKSINSKIPEFDKFYHCMGNCKAAEVGFGGKVAAASLSVFREVVNLPNDLSKPNMTVKEAIKDSYNDMKANFEGFMKGGFSGVRCYDACINYHDRIKRQP